MPERPVMYPGSYNSYLSYLISRYEQGEAMPEGTVFYAPPPRYDVEWEPTYQCRSCHRMAPESAISWVVTQESYGEVAICHECMAEMSEAESVSTCVHCNTPSLHMTTIREQDYCPCCEPYFNRECAHCGTHPESMYEAGRFMQSIQHDGTIMWLCRDCFSEHYGSCHNCGGAFERDELQEFRGREYCEECYEEQKYNVIQGYHSCDKTSVWFRTEDERSERVRNLVYTGTELEVEFPDLVRKDKQRAAYEFITMFPDSLMYAETDGSLDNGVEFITAPITRAFFEELKPTFVSGLRKLIRWGGRSHKTSTCGLHIHISRQAFAPGGWDESLGLCILMVEKHWDDIVKLSRRGYNGIDCWSKKHFGYGTPSWDDIQELFSYDSYDHDRYTAVNICNENTVEFRFFRGTLMPETFFAAHDLVYALVDAANNLTLAQVNASHNLRSCIEPYCTDELLSYLDSRNVTR